MSIKSLIGNLVLAFSTPVAEKKPAIQEHPALQRMANRYHAKQRADAEKGGIDYALEQRQLSANRANAWAERMTNDF